MRKILPLIAALGLLLAACGSSGSNSSKDTSTSGKTTTTAASSGGSSSTMAKAAGLTGTTNDHGTKSVAAGKSIEVEMDDKYFSPTFIKAPSGAAFTVELKNEGSLPHTFTVDSLGIDEQVDPGKSAEVKVTMPAKAAAFHCDFHGGMGMQGALVVDGAGGSSSGASGSSGSDSSTTTTAASSGGGGY